jgi:hypothetical protein
MEKKGPTKIAAGRDIFIKMNFYRPPNSNVSVNLNFELKK